MSKIFFILSAILFSLALNAGEVVEFHIVDGTDDQDWNLEADMVTVQIGDTLRIYNDDEIVHRLHTNGSPCSHGPDIDPGESWDCEIERPFDPFGESGSLYDHYTNGLFWMTAVEEDEGAEEE